MPGVFTVAVHVVEAGPLSSVQMSPRQVMPPCSGAGSVQVRVRSWVPTPQVVEQALNADQPDHLPSTTRKAYLGMGGQGLDGKWPTRFPWRVGVCTVCMAKGHSCLRSVNFTVFFLCPKRGPSAPGF